MNASFPTHVMKSLFVGGLLAGALLLGGCRGTPSKKPPIHPNLNMDFQPRFDPQEENDFFPDKRAMREPVPGTVARTPDFEKKLDSRYYEGKEPDGSFVKRMPVPLTMALLKRGQDRYNIYCAPCHGLAGDGKGVVIDYGYVPATSYHDDRLRNVEDGYLYEVIRNGIRNMPAYDHLVPVDDRWAIVAYIRALQRSQHASEKDVPPEILAKLKASAQ